MNPLFRSITLAGLFGIICLFSGSFASSEIFAPQAVSEADAWENSATAAIRVTQWAAAERGWLYLLDGSADLSTGSGHITLFDPVEGKIMGSIRTGANPDFSLSPDGKSLFVASKAKDRSSSVAIINTSSGNIIRTVTIEGRVTTTGLPSYSGMSVSDDGGVLRILTNDPRSSDGDFILQAIDTTRGEARPNSVDLDDCGFGRFIDQPSEEQFDYLCPESNRVRQVNIDEKTGKADHETVQFPWPRRVGVAEAFLENGGRYMAFVRGDGEVDGMNVDQATFAGSRQRYVIEGLVLPGQWPLSPDRKRIYLGYDLHPDPKFYMRFERSTYYPRAGAAYEFSVFDTETWKHVGNMRGKWSDYWSAVISPDGDRLYALSPENGGIAVFDTGSMKEVRQIKTGGAPALALVEP